VTTKEYVDQKDTQLEAAIDAMNIQLAQINTQIGDLQEAVAQRDATIENLQGDLVTATAERDVRPTLQEVQDGRPGSVLLSVDSEAGAVVLNFTVEESEDLITWTPVEGPGVSQTLTLPAGKRFYRFAH